MAHAAHPFSFREHAFLWALVLSLALHVVLISTKGFHFDTPRPADSLIIQLQEPVQPPPPPPEPPKAKTPPPKPPRIKPEPHPSEMPQPLPPPVTAPATPVQPHVEPPPEPAPSTPAPPPEVVAVAPKSETPPAFTVPPPPEPPKVTGPSPQDLDAARNGYSNLLAREFSKYRQYPRIAQLRGWQGTVRVQLELDANGNITQSGIKESSGFEALDKQALEMVKKATPLPPPPDVMRNRPFNILVPVTFKLN